MDIERRLSLHLRFGAVDPCWAAARSFSVVRTESKYSCTVRDQPLVWSLGAHGFGQATRPARCDLRLVFTFLQVISSGLPRRNIFANMREGRCSAGIITPLLVYDWLLQYRY